VRQKKYKTLSKE